MGTTSASDVSSTPDATSSSQETRMFTWALVDADSSWSVEGPFVADEPGKFGAAGVSQDSKPTAGRLWFPLLEAAVEDASSSS
jgi:hypothetical protein